MSDFDSNQGFAAFGAGVEGFAKGLMDVEDRRHKKMEMDAKLKAQEDDRYRQRMEDDAKKREESFRRKKELIDYGEKYEIPEGVTDISQVDPNPEKYRDSYIKMLQARGEATASADPYGNKSRPTEGEYKAGGFASRMSLAEGDLENLIKKGFDPTTMSVAVQESLPAGGVIGKLAESKKDPSVKLYQQAKRNWITANLRRESGAVITDTEMAEEEKKYFPQAGDTPEVIEQKRMARAQSRANLESEGERAIKRIPQMGLVPRGLVGKEKGLVTAPKADAEKAAKLKRLQELRAKAAGG